MPIEDLERKLYQKNNAEIEARNKAETPASNSRVRVDEGRAWSLQENLEELRGRSRVEERGERINLKKSQYHIKKIVLWAVACVGLATVAIVAYLVYQAFNLSGISLMARYPDQVLLGTPLDFVVSYSNNASSILKDAKISLTLPVEFSFVSEANSKRVVTKNVGDIGVGTVGQEVFRVIAIAGSQSSKHIIIGLDYNSSALGPRFHKETGSDVFIGEPAAMLDLIAPDKVLSSEVFEVHIPYKNVSPDGFTDVELTLELPANFTPKTSSRKSDTGTTWRLGDLKADSSDELVIAGTVLAPANSFFDVKATLTSSVNGARYTIAAKGKSIAVSASPLTLSIAVNHATDYIAKAGETLSYAILYTNNTDVGFRDVIITTKLVGQMFDLMSLATNGSFSSVLNTITWNASNDQTLQELAPHASGSVEFRVSMLKDYPINRFNDKNFTLKVSAQIESPTVPAFLSADKTLSVDELETKIAGIVMLHASALFRDAASGILNKGELPLKANQKTQFTVHWLVKNYATDVSSFEARAFLSPGVKATGVAKSNTATKPEYNDRTGELVWRVPKIEAGRGILGPPLEAIFQIEVEPPITSVGNYISLVGETNVMATDVFTGTKLNVTDKEITSELREDPSANSGDGKVVP